MNEAEVGHGGAQEEWRGKQKSTYASIALQFIVAVLLAFIGFTLQGLRTDTATSLATSQANQVAIGGISSKLDDINNRLDRLERTQDAGRD